MSIDWFVIIVAIVVALFGIMGLLTQLVVRIQQTKKEREENEIADCLRERFESGFPFRWDIAETMVKLQQKQERQAARLRAVKRRGDNTERIRKQAEQLKGPGQLGGQLRGPIGQILGCQTQLKAGSLFNTDPRQPGKSLTSNDKDFLNASLQKEGKLECPVCELGYLLVLAEDGCSVNLICDNCEKKYNIVFFANQIVVGEYL